MGSIIQIVNVNHPGFWDDDLFSDYNMAMMKLLDFLKSIKYNGEFINKEDECIGLYDSISWMIQFDQDSQSKKHSESLFSEVYSWIEDCYNGVYEAERFLWEGIIELSKGTLGLFPIIEAVRRGILPFEVKFYLDRMDGGNKRSSSSDLLLMFFFKNININKDPQLSWVDFWRNMILEKSYNKKVCA